MQRLATWIGADAGEQIGNNSYPATGTSLNKIHLAIKISTTAVQSQKIALRVRLKFCNALRFYFVQMAKVELSTL